MRELFMNGRHRRMFVLIAMQYVLDMPPDLRSQVDYVFALRDTIHSSRDKLWKQVLHAHTHTPRDPSGRDQRLCVVVRAVLRVLPHVP